MKLVTGITAQPKQQMTVVLDDGSFVFVYLEYRAQQSGWFANLLWGNWELNGLRLTPSPNLLQKWSQILPFGLGILTQDNVELLNLTAFASGIATVYQLNAEDVVMVEEVSFVGN